MTPEAPRPRRILDLPGRVAAIGGAAVVCVLSVSGALGLSHAVRGGDSAPPAAESAIGDLVGGGFDATGGHDPTSTGTGASGTAGNVSAGGSGSFDSGGDAAGAAGSDSTTSDAKSTHQAAQGTALPARSGTGKRVVFDVSAQRVWLVDADGSVVRTYLVSGSKYDNLDTGVYHVYSRDRYATAYNSNETMDYMVRFATGRTSPIGFHSIPAYPNGRLVEARSELGAPASDGCIRQWITDARALWNFSPEGTTVVVRA